MELEEKKTILLVEDDIGDQKLMKFALRKENVDDCLKWVENGEEAIEYLEQSKKGDPGKPWPSLIFLDLNMPGMGGKEFLKTIKASGEYCGIPVIIVSTSDAQMDIQETYRLQAAGYVQKSASPDELHKIVSKLLKYWFATSRLVRI